MRDAAAKSCFVDLPGNIVTALAAHVWALSMRFGGPLKTTSTLPKILLAVLQILWSSGHFLDARLCRSSRSKASVIQSLIWINMGGSYLAYILMVGACFFVKKPSDFANSHQCCGGPRNGQ